MDTDSTEGKRIVFASKWVSNIGTYSCGIIMLGILYMTIWGFSVKQGKSDAGIEFPAIFFIFIPSISIPVGISCQAGTILRWISIRKYSSNISKKELWSPLLWFLATLAFYGICFAMMFLAGI